MTSTFTNIDTDYRDAVITNITALGYTPQVMCEDVIYIDTDSDRVYLEFGLSLLKKNTVYISTGRNSARWATMSISDRTPAAVAAAFHFLMTTIIGANQ